MEKPTPLQLREAFTGCAWSYSQACMFVQEVHRETGNAWEWLVPRIREALIAEKAFTIVRIQHRDHVKIVEADRLLASMRVAAGLAELHEVLHQPTRDACKRCGLKRFEHADTAIHHAFEVP